MELLLNGTPQAVNSGPLLLGLGAWYIYPEIIVLGNDSARHSFGDLTVPSGGVVTIGLGKGRPENENDAGIHWCLSFAHLRYYGKPVSRQRKLSNDSSRLTFEQFLKAALGSVMGVWDSSEASLVLYSKFFVAIESTLDSNFEYPPGDPNQRDVLAYRSDRCHWVHLLARAESALVDINDIGFEETCILFRKGVRSSSRFIKTLRGSSPFLGLSRFAIMTRCLNGPEARIRFLRWYAERKYKSDDGFIIRYYWNINSKSASDHAQ